MPTQSLEWPQRTWLTDAGSRDPRAAPHPPPHYDFSLLRQPSSRFTMFTAFTCNGPAKVQFSRTACDICRAKNVGRPSAVRSSPPQALTCLQLKCRGTGDACDGCVASSSACTYTFSSGVGLGKKRRRKVCSPSFNANFAQQRPLSPPRSTSHGCDGGPLPRDAPSDRRSSEWNHLLDTPGVAVVTPAELLRDEPLKVHDQHTPRASDKDWSDMCLSGEGFVLCPGTLAGPASHPPLQPSSMPPALADSESALRSHVASSLEADIFHMFEMSSPPQNSRQTSFGQEALQSGALDLATVFASRPPSSHSSGLRQSNPDTAQDEPFGPSAGLSIQCDCLASICQRFKELDPQQSSDIKVALTDTLFQSVEKGIDQFAKMLSCNNCNINDVNPMLVVTNVNQLALMLSEIVHRLIHCQSPASVPAIFQFGMYSVQKTKMRTRLLAGMIEIHVHCLNQLITRLEKCIADQPRMLLAGARNIVTNMEQTLSAFLGGSYTYCDS